MKSSPPPEQALHIEGNNGPLPCKVNAAGVDKASLYAIGIGSKIGRPIHDEDRRLMFERFKKALRSLLNFGRS